MLRVTVTQFNPDDPPELLAELSVDEDGVRHVSGRQVSEVANAFAIDPLNGDRLVSSDDPMRWARLLPHAFSGGQVASVQEA